MKPWHLIPKDDRDHVLSRFRNAVEWSTLEAGRAAIALLEAAAPYGDEDLVVRHESGAMFRVYDWADDIGGWYGGCKLYGFGAYGDHGDTQAVFAIDRCTPLTPAADSLLRALRGDE